MMKRFVLGAICLVVLLAVTGPAVAQPNMLASGAFCDEGLAVTSATAGQLEAMEDQFDGDTIAAAMNICAKEVGFGLWNLFDYDQEAQGRVHVEFLP